MHVDKTGITSFTGELQARVTAGMEISQNYFKAEDTVEYQKSAQLGTRDCVDFRISGH